MLTVRLKRIRDRRLNILDKPKDKNIDWSMGEELAYASVLADGIPIRITGQDCERGTFSHRHAVLHDENKRQDFHTTTEYTTC